MAWEVPINVNGKTYNARFEGDTEPTDSQIEYATKQILDPQAGQSESEAIKNSAASGFETGLAQTFATGPGAIGDALGMHDNLFLRAGLQMENDIANANPISLENQGKFAVKAAGAIGQGAAMAVTAPLAEASQGFRAASLATKMRQIAFIGGFQGAAAGEEEAMRLGVTDSWSRAELILGYGATEAASELLGGYAAETAVPSALKAFLRGAPPPRIPHIISAFAGEGLEEIGAGVPQRYLSKSAATEDPNNKGFSTNGQPIYNPWDTGQIMEEGLLGGVAGSTLVGAAHVFNHLNPQQQKDVETVTKLPEALRKQAWDALQQVSAGETEAVALAKNIDENTAAAMRVAIAGQRAAVIDEAAAATAKEFAAGWQEREKASLVHSGEEHDSFYEKGNWMIVTGTDANGQPVFAPATDAQKLEELRQVFIKTGDLPEGMQALQAGQPAATPAQAAPAPAGEQPAPAEQPPAAKPFDFGSGMSFAAETPPVAPTPVDFKTAEIARVQKDYPNSPELVTGIENAIGDTGAKAFLDNAEPRAKLVEEITGMEPSALEEKLRSEGVDERTIDRQTASGQVNPQSAANAIIRARENTPEKAAPQETLEVTAAKARVAQMPQEQVAVVARGASQLLTPTQIAKTHEIPVENVQAVFTAQGIPQARNEPGGPVTPKFRKWMQTNYPQQAKELVRSEARAAREKAGPRVARLPSQFRQAVESREFKNNPTVQNDVISKIRSEISAQGAPMPRLVPKREGGKIVGLMIDPELKGEWDWFKPLLEDKELRDLYQEMASSPSNTGGGTNPISDIAVGLNMREDEAGQAIMDAFMQRVQIARDITEGRGQGAQEDAMAQEEKQALAFSRATEEGNQQVTPVDLLPGDKLDIKGEPFEVKGKVLDYDDQTNKARVQTADGEKTMRLDKANVGDVILQDGAKFGRQVLSTGESIWVESHDRSGQPAEDTPEPPAKEQQPTERTAFDEFESRLRDAIKTQGLDSWTNADIENAVDYHLSRNPDKLTFAQRHVIWGVERGMRTPSEVRADQRQETAKVEAVVDKVEEDTGADSSTDPEVVDWANKVVMVEQATDDPQKELDALPDEVEPQHFIDGVAPALMKWAMTTKARVQNFGAFLKAGLSRFGAGFAKVSKKLWTAVQVSIIAAVGFHGSTSHEANIVSAAPEDLPKLTVPFEQPAEPAAPEGTIRIPLNPNAKPTIDGEAIKGIAVFDTQLSPSSITNIPLASISEMPGSRPKQANFGKQKVSTQTRNLANWIVANNNHEGSPFVVADKRAGTVTMFDAQGNAVKVVPALFGKEAGDVRQGEKRITPAGRFGVDPTDIGPYVGDGGQIMPEMGTAMDIAPADPNAEAMIAIHQLYVADPSEERPQRLASPDPKDNRISYGCINLDAQEMEETLLPLFKDGGFVYVLPETKEGRATFSGFQQAVQWANRVSAEGNLNAGLNPRLLAAHAIRTADWILKNGANFAHWSSNMLSAFGSQINGALRTIWQQARNLLHRDGQLDQVPQPAGQQPARRVGPLSPQDVAARTKDNPYSEGTWEAGQAKQAELEDRGDTSIRFVRTAEDSSHFPELVNGEPFAIEPDGTVVIVTDQVHVTLADVREARRNDTGAGAEAINRVTQEARRKAAETNIAQDAHRQARNVLSDIESAPQWPAVVNLLWDAHPTEMEDILGTTGVEPTQEQKTDAARIWVDDHFAEPIASVLANNASLSEPMLPAGADTASRQVEQLVKDALQAPYVKPRIRFSARNTARDRFMEADEAAKNIRNNDAERIRAINGEALLSTVTNEAAREWGMRKLEHYARLTETGQLDNRHLTESFTTDYLPLYARREPGSLASYDQALRLVRGAVRQITGDNVAKYGYHDPRNEPTSRQILREDVVRANIHEAQASAGALQDQPNGQEQGNAPGVRSSQQGPRSTQAGVAKGDVRSAITGLANILPNVDNTWVGTRPELANHLRTNDEFRQAWIEDWKATHPGEQQATPEAAFDDFVNHGLEGMEALTFHGRTYLMNDQVEVKPERGGTAALSARWVLIHENTHEVVDHILDRFPELRQQWQALRARVNPAQLDDLARTRWIWMQDWRNNPELHDRIVHEWVSERVAEIEQRGQPTPDSLLGKFMQWLQDVWKAAMGGGSNITPSDKALLTFIEAARESYREVLDHQAAQGLRFSAQDADGNMSGSKVTASINDGPDEPVGVTPPPKRQKYNHWSNKRRAEYEAFNANPDLPADMRHFTQFLGEETNDERLTQAVAPMLDMSNRRLGGVHGELPDVNPESTAAAYSDARALHERKTFARRYQQEFQTWYGTNDQGQVIHAGDAAVAVHQLNLMRYAVRLMAETGDARLFTQMQPFANDVILSDFTTMSGAARMLQVRSLASRSDVGVWTALQLTSGAQHEAAASDVGEEARDTIAKVISSQEVKDEIQQGMEESPEAEQAAAEMENTASEYEQEGYRERAVQLLDEQAKAWDAELDKTLRRLDEISQLVKSMEAKASSSARPSMQEDASKFKTIEEARAEMDRLKAKAKDLLSKLTQQDTSHESKAQRRKRVRDHKNAHKALSADDQAKALLERYENRNKRTKRDKPAWKSTFDSQVTTPQPAADFIAAVQKHGVSPEIAQKLSDLADTLHQERATRFADKVTQDAAKKPAGQKKGVNAATFLNSIVQQILKTPLSQQRVKTQASTTKEGDIEIENTAGIANPWNRDWVKDTFTNALMEQGVPQDKAQQMAEKLSGRFDDIMRKAQEKAAVKAAKGLKVKDKTVQRIGQAIRSGALDATNANPVIAALAAEAGYKGLTSADLQRLAQLDDIINNSVPTLVAKAYTEITRILAKASPNKKFSKIAEQLFINGALSSLGVLQLNWMHPAYILPRMLVNDMAGIIRDAAFSPGQGTRAANVALAADLFTSLWQARHGMLSDAIFSLKNDAYQTRMIELHSVEHSLYRELMQAVDELKNGNAGKKALAIPKILWLSSDWVRRILSSADQMWGGVIQQYVLRNEAMRTMIQNLGMDARAAHGILNQAINEGEAAQTAHENAGNPSTEAVLVGRDVMRESLARGISFLAGNDKAGIDVLTTAAKSSVMELGNGRGENSPAWDVPNFLLESFKSAASAVRNKMDSMSVPFGRAFTGFVSVASNIMNRSFYFTPLGFARVWAKTHGSEAKRAKIYTETMATQGMVRARLNEAIVSTVATALLAMLRWKKKDDKEGMTITGNGPTNPAMREAWLKQHKAGHIEWRNKQGHVIVSIPYTRGGFDHLATPLTAIGALEDMDLNGHRARPKDFNWGWAYAQQLAGNQIKQAQFFGVRELSGSVPSSEKPHAMAGWLGYSINPWTPWGGLTKSIFKTFSGTQEEGSVKAAFLSNVPIAQIITGDIVGPRLNFLGDQIGGQPSDTLKKMAERASYSGFPMYIALDPQPKDGDIYDFIVRKGVAPAMPMRGDMESKNGFLTDEQWAGYVKLRGDLLKTAIRANMARIEKALPADAQSMMETISRDATRTAKARLKLN